MVIIPVDICRIMVTLTPTEGGCIQYSNDNRSQSPQEEVECCCYDMKIESTYEHPICEFKITLSDIDPFCCVDPISYNWRGGYPDENGVVTLTSRNLGSSLRPDNPLFFRVCGRNTDGFVSICLEGYDCNGVKYCERCSDPIPANQTCWYWTPTAVRNNQQFNEAVILKAPYPNPSSVNTTFSYKQNVDGIMLITIVDPQGKLVQKLEQKGFSGNSYLIEIFSSQLTEGAYIATFAFNGLSRDVKFIVKR